MKKNLVIALLLLLINIRSIFANEYEKPILFQNIPWGTSYDKFIDMLPIELKESLQKGLERKNNMAIIDPIVYFFTDPLSFYNISIPTDNLFWEPLGFEVSDLNDNGEIKIAGHVPDIITYSFGYLLCDGEILCKADDKTALLKVEYFFMMSDYSHGDVINTYEEYKDKLSYLYGDIDFSVTGNSYQGNPDDEIVIWSGADGTMVSLLLEGSGIRITYSYNDADSIIKNAYNAIVLEKQNYDLTDVSGL